MKPSTEFIFPNYLEDLCEAWELVGSRVTCNPPPTDTDQDILVLITDKKLDTFMQELEANGWESDANKASKAIEDKMPPVPKMSEFSDVTLYQLALINWCEACDEIEEQAAPYGDLITGDTTFASWRKGELNLILTTDEAWYDNFLEASECCKALNVMEKSKRVEIFTKIREKLPKKEKVISTTGVNSLVQAQNVTNWGIDLLSNGASTYPWVNFAGVFGVTNS